MKTKTLIKLFSIVIIFSMLLSSCDLIKLSDSLKNQPSKQENTNPGGASAPSEEDEEEATYWEGDPSEDESWTGDHGETPPDDSEDYAYEPSEESPIEVESLPELEVIMPEGGIPVIELPVEEFEPPGDERPSIKSLTPGQPDSALPVSDAEIPMVNRLGSGYDIFGEYAENISVKEPVLDIRKLLQQGEVLGIRLNSYDSRLIVEETIEKYMNKMAVSVGAKGHYLGFSGSVKTRFGEERSSEARNYYATYSWIARKYRVYIRRTTDLSQFLLDRFVQDVMADNYTVDKILEGYGQYVLVNTIVGGRIDYNVTESSLSSKDLKTFGMDVEVAANFVFAGGQVNVSYESSNLSEHFNKNKRETFHVAGGSGLRDSQIGNDALFNTWMASLDSEGAFVEFPENERVMVPIWEIVRMIGNDRANQRAQEIENVVKARAEAIKGSLPKNTHMQPRYVTKMGLGLSSSRQTAREEAAIGNRTVLEPHLCEQTGGEKYQYLGIEFGGPDSYWGAITDLLISYEHKGDWVSFVHNGQQNDYFLVKNRTEEDSPSYHTDWADLNKGAGGDTLYLYASYENTDRKAPIYDVMVYDSSIRTNSSDKTLNFNNVKEYAKNEGWEIVYCSASDVPCDLNEGAGGHFLFLLVKKDFFVMHRSGRIGDNMAMVK